MSTQIADIAKLKTDVAVLKRDMKYVVQSVDTLNKKLDSINFINKDEYVKDQKLLDERLIKVEKVIEDGAPGRLISKEVRKFILLGIGTAVGIVVAVLLGRVGVK